MRKLILYAIIISLNFWFIPISEAVNLKKGIIGKWVEVKRDGSYGERIEFLKDGTVIVVSGGSSGASDYKFIDDNRMRVDLKGIFGSGAMVFEVSIDKAGQLILTDPAGKVETYIANTKTEREKWEKKVRAEREKRDAAEKAERERREAEARRKAKDEEKRLKTYFTDNGNGTITVNETKLIWTKDANLPQKSLNWYEAMKYVEGMNKGIYPNYGYTDWRLPTKEELIELRKSLKNPYAPFTTTDKVQQGSHWSSTTTENTREAWFVSIWHSSNMGHTEKNASYYVSVWPVRAGVASSSAPSKFPPPTPQQDKSESQVEATSSKLSAETPEKITIAWLTKDMPDAKHFPEREETFNVNFDDTWNAVITAFKKEKIRIISSDKERGIIITDEKIGQVLFPYKEKFVVLIEKLSDASTKITVKGMGWNKFKGQWEVSKFKGGAGASEIFLKEIRKELKSKIKQSSSSDSQPKSADPQKLKTYITDQWKQVIRIPPPKRDWRELVTLKITGKYDDYSSLYLLGVNMRGRASDAFASADKFRYGKEVASAPPVEKVKLKLLRGKQRKAIKQKKMA